MVAQFLFPPASPRAHEVSPGIGPPDGPGRAAPLPTTGVWLVRPFGCLVPPPLCSSQARSLSPTAARETLGAAQIDVKPSRGLRDVHRGVSTEGLTPSRPFSYRHRAPQLHNLR